MCSIIGTTDKDQLIELYDLNAYRGQLTFSLAGFNKDCKLLHIEKHQGKISKEFIEEFPDCYYYVGHQQAPTTEHSNIHPAEINNSLLWHNGIVKQRGFDVNQWDTQWILSNIEHSGLEFLSEIDGTFACVLYRDENLYIFRNEISPLFVSDSLSISSTKTNNLHSLAPNTLFKINLHRMVLEEEFKFSTKDNPYYFG